MNVLVTGSAGHLGEALVRTLRSKGGIDVLGLDQLESPTTDVVGSVAEPDLVQACVAGVDAVLHTATLHKPHIETHTSQQFVDTNITGTLALLEAAVAARVSAFVFTSTTSAFGRALRPGPGRPAAWVTEELAPVPRNIYGVTKTAAEDICQLFHQRHGLPCVVLRTSRFFPEQDDDQTMQRGYHPDNLKVNELLYRRADLEDVVDAHIAALEGAGRIGFDRFIVSATTPFRSDDVCRLRTDLPAVLDRRVPGWREVYQRVGWKMLDGIDRVYVNERARERLGWMPRYDFRYALDCLQTKRDFRSPLAQAVGCKGYHRRGSQREHQG